MRFKILEDLLWYVYQFLRYKKYYIDFAFGSRLKKSNFAKHLNIGTSIVYNSSLGTNVSIGDNCNIFNSTLESQVSIYSGCNITDSSIGKFTYIAGDSYFNFVKIGRFCSIGPQTLCGNGEHPTDFVSTHPVFFSNLRQCGTSFTEDNLFDELKEVIIGNDVWIGARVFIRGGITIGNGAILGAGSVVVKDVPAYAIVGGVPAKIIRFRFTEEIVNKLQSIEWWNLPEDRLREAQSSIAQNDIQLFIDWYENNFTSKQ